MAFVRNSAYKACIEGELHNTMLAYISALLLLGFALLLMELQKTYYFFPARELKRQARAGDREATVLYRAVAYGASLRLLLWLLIGLTVAGSFMLLTIVAPAWLGFFAIVGLVWYGFAWAPNARVGSVGARLAMLLTPVVTWTLYYTHPFLDWAIRNIERHRPVTFHTGLFERDDLIELIKNQRDMADSRIPDAELDLVLHALSFGEKTVQSVMVPRRSVKTVRQTDIVGPILMDELYESQYSRFPVIGADKKAVEAILYLRDLISAKHGGTVGDVMKSAVHYVHEDQTLYHVLHAFLTTKQHLFVVIDSDEAYVGIITIEDVLEQVIGHRIQDDFDAYDDKRAVAGSLRKVHVELPAEPDTTESDAAHIDMEDERVVRAV